MAKTYLQINKLVCQSQKYKNSTKASLVPLHNTLTLYDTEQAQLGNSLITGKEFLSHMSFQILFESEDIYSRPRPHLDLNSSFATYYQWDLEENTIASISPSVQMG